MRTMGIRHVPARHGSRGGLYRPHLLQRGGKQAPADGRVVQRYVLGLAAADPGGVPAAVTPAELPINAL